MTATTKPAVNAQLGGGHIATSGSITVTSESHPDADAFANNVSVGIGLSLSKLTANAKSADSDRCCSGWLRPGWDSTRRPRR